jgi:hypothetical protein
MSGCRFHVWGSTGKLTAAKQQSSRRTGSNARTINVSNFSRKPEPRLETVIEPLQSPTSIK